MKIKILYSHLNVTGTDFKARPEWFDFEKCFQNLLRTTVGHYDYLNNVNIPGIDTKTNPGIEIHIIFDKSRGGLEQNWINTRRNYPHLKFHEIQGGSMMGAAKEMYRIAKELSSDMEDDDLFMFQENDYLFVDGWVDKIKELFTTYKLDGGYVSLYSHPDKFTSLYQDLVCKIIVTDSHHFNTVPSTCGSYIINKKTFLEDYNFLTTYEGDHSKFIKLNEDKGRYVLTPIPTLSTHCMSQHLAHCINWEKISNG
jgi:hypothetical protein